MKTCWSPVWLTSSVALALFIQCVAAFAQAPGDARRSQHPSRALLDLDPAAKAAVVASLTKELERGHSTVRERTSAIAALESLGASAADAIPALELQLTNGTAEISFAAYRAIGVIRSEPPLDKASLRAGGAGACRGTSGFRAFTALGQGVLPKTEAMALLGDVLRGQPPLPEQIMAVETLGRLEPSDPESIALILDAVASTNGFVSTNAAGAVAKARMTDPRVREILATALVTREDRVAVESAKALARFGPAAAPHVKLITTALQHCTGHTDSRRVGAYLHVLRAVGRDASEAGPVLVGMLAEDSLVYQGRPSFLARAVRRYLLLALADAGVPADAIPAVLDELTNALEPATLAAAARAAGAVTSGQDQVVPFLKRALARKGLETGVRLETIESRSGPVIAPDTSPYLEIVRALARLGPASKAALPELRERARDAVRHSPNFPAYQQEAARVAETLSR